MFLPCEQNLMSRSAVKVLRPVAHPLGEQPFLAGSGRQAGMQRTGVWCASGIDAPPEQRVALAAAKTPAESREVGFARFVILVQIDQEGQHALAILGGI